MFITLEGIEGSGKSTLAAGLADMLRRGGHDVLLTREPGGSDLGRKIRPLLLSVTEKPCPEAELFLFLADRAQHVKEVILPALRQGRFVICDRFVDSTTAYQGAGRGMDIRDLGSLNSMAVASCMPDITLIPDLPAEVGLARACRRNSAEGLTAGEGRFEAEELAFHERIRQGFRDIAAGSPQRVVLLDGTLAPAELLAAAFGEIVKRMR